MPGINVHLTFTCKIFQGLCFPCHASRDQSAPAGPCAVCGIQSPLSVSPALRRDKANALRSPRSRPKRGAQGAGASLGWLRARGRKRPRPPPGMRCWGMEIMLSPSVTPDRASGLGAHHGTMRQVRHTQSRGSRPHHPPTTTTAPTRDGPPDGLRPSGVTIVLRG